MYDMIQSFRAGELPSVIIVLRFSQVQERNYWRHRSSSQSGGALHVDRYVKVACSPVRLFACLVCVWCGKLSRGGRWVSSLLLCVLNCEQFHSLRSYRTSVSPLTLSLSSWKFNRAACPLQYSFSSSNLNIEDKKTVRQEQIQCSRHKMDTKPNQRFHHRIERAC